MRVRNALLALLEASADYRRFFRRLCEEGPPALEGQAWQFRDELADRGRTFPLADVREALFGLAHDLLPESPAAGRDAA